MKTWILCVNKCGASVYMRQDNQEKLSSVDLFYCKPVIDGETDELQGGFTVFLASEIGRILRECESTDILFVCAKADFSEQIIDRVEESIRASISGVINEDLRSTPVDYISKYTKEVIERQAC